MAFFIAAIISLTMFTQGIVLTRYPGSGGAASVAALTWVCGGEEQAGYLLIATLPFVFFARVRQLRVLALVQWVVSLIYAAGALHAMMLGTYADNYVPVGGAPFIINDQIELVTLFVIHTTALGFWLL